MKIKPIVVSFFTVQLLDFFTTAIGLTLFASISEQNPMQFDILLIIKVIVILGIGYLLQNYFKSKFSWLIVIASSWPFMWNLLVIFMEIFKK